MLFNLDIPEDQQARLEALATRRGEDDLSKIIREAIARYLDQEMAPRRELQDALAVIGSLTEEQAETMRSSIRRLRETWRA